jgi:hypothetical protein
MRKTRIFRLRKTRILIRVFRRALFYMYLKIKYIAHSEFFYFVDQ